MAAASELKCYLLRKIRLHCEAHPQTPINIHMDDVAIDAEGPSPEECFDKLESSAIGLARVFQQLHLPLAPDKAVCVGSCKHAVARASKALGEIG